MRSSRNDEDDSRQLERKILVEIDDIDRRFEALRQERTALQRLLVSVRAKTVGMPDVTRKNSVNRIVIEEKILSVLRNSERSEPTKKLFREVLNTHPSVKAATFRSYLHRLQSRGLIEPALARGFWQMSADDPKR